MVSPIGVLSVSWDPGPMSTIHIRISFALRMSPGQMTGEVAATNIRVIGSSSGGALPKSECKESLCFMISNVGAANCHVIYSSLGGALPMKKKTF